MKPTPAQELAAIRHGARCTADESREVALAAIAKYGGVARAAKALGVSRQTIADWRNGKHTAPKRLIELTKKAGND